MDDRQMRLNIEVTQGSELVAQERAAAVTARLYTKGSLTLSEARDITGLTYSGVWYLMSKVCRVAPIWYERDTQTWFLEQS